MSTIAIRWPRSRALPHVHGLHLSPALAPPNPTRGRHRTVERTQGRSSASARFPPRICRSHRGRGVGKQSGQAYVRSVGVHDEYLRAASKGGQEQCWPRTYPCRRLGGVGAGDNGPRAARICSTDGSETECPATAVGAAATGSLPPAGDTIRPPWLHGIERRDLANQRHAVERRRILPVSNAPSAAGQSERESAGYQDSDH